MTRYPVCDGDEGADIYGAATTAKGACRVAARYYADDIDHAELYGPIALRDGRTLPLAWVVFAREWQPEAKSYVGKARRAA